MLRDIRGTVREQGLREGTRGKEGEKGGEKGATDLRKAKEGGWRVAFWNVNNGGVCEAG